MHGRSIERCRSGRLLFEFGRLSTGGPRHLQLKIGLEPVHQDVEMRGEHPIDIQRLMRFEQ